jgi:hypothetical protein
MTTGWTQNRLSWIQGEFKIGVEGHSEIQNTSVSYSSRIATLGDSGESFKISWNIEDYISHTLAALI